MLGRTRLLRVMTAAMALAVVFMALEAAVVLVPQDKTALPLRLALEAQVRLLQPRPVILL